MIIIITNQEVKIFSSIIFQFEFSAPSCPEGATSNSSKRHLVPLMIIIPAVTRSTTRRSESGQNFQNTAFFKEIVM